MKNQTAKPKSTITHILAACFVLAVLGPPAAELSRAGDGRGGPPQHVNVTFFLPGMCGFDVQVHGLGLFQIISLPRGNVLFAFGGGGSNTFTNLSDPSKSVTFNVTGEGNTYTDENGNTVIQSHGTAQVWGPSIGIWNLTGDWNFLDDPDGNLICPPGATCTQFADYVTGNGQVIDICGLIQ